MRILIFTEGTILQHKNAAGGTREEIVRQVKEKEVTVKDYSSYVPIEGSAQKVAKWKKQGAEVFYLTSRRTPEQIQQIRAVLKRHKFPAGKLLFRKEGEDYKDVAERLVPDIFIEDDCESIGEDEITINHVKPEIRRQIKSILVKEFGGIKHLPDEINKLLGWKSFFIIIRGPLGCGKSTIAKRISGLLNAEDVAIDRVLDEYNLTKDKEEGYIAQRSFIKANEIIIPKAKRKLQSGIPVVFGGNFYWKSQIEDLIKKLDFPHFVFTLKAPLKVCIERDHLRKKAHGEDATKAVYKKATRFNYGLAIDISKPLDKAIKSILSPVLKKINQKKLGNKK